VRVHALDRHLPVPAGAHDLRQAEGVVGVGLVDLQAERCLRVSRIEADDGNTAPTKVERQPIRELPGLKADLDSGRGVSLHRGSDGIRSRSALTAPEHGPLVIDHKSPWFRATRRARHNAVADP
jgi:hypothetical protein